MKTVIGINGACGRMGQRIIQLAHEDKDLTLGAALEVAGHPQQGRDIGEVAGLGKLGVPVRSDLPLDLRLDVLIDFSMPEGTMAVLPVCVQRRIPLVVATTGHTPAQRQEIEAAAHQTAVLMAPNMSLAVNVLMKLVAPGGGGAARTRASTWRSSSGTTASRRTRPAARPCTSPASCRRRWARPSCATAGEGLVGERPAHEIGIHAIRVGDNVGEHTILFSTLGETLELTHRAHARDCYARGALQAAKFLADRPAGRYTMEDVLGL